MKTYAGYKLVKPGNPGRPVYVRDDESAAIFERVIKEFRTNYHFTTIFRTICLLNADSQRGSARNIAGDKREIQSGNIYMSYDIADGSVFLHTLVIQKTPSPSKIGLYTVKYYERDEQWIPENEPIENLKDSATWQSNTGRANYVAVSGRFANIDSASLMMPQHLVGAYRKADFLTRTGAGQEYSLFWSEKGIHKSEEAAQSLAAIMQQSTQNGLPVNWLIHGEGVHTFIKAAKILKNAPIADAVTIKQNPNAGKVKNQNVFFSNPASRTSESKLKELAQDAGLEYQGLNTNNRDLKRWRTLKNAGVELTKYTTAAAVAGAGATSVIAKSSGTSGLGKSITAIFNGMSSGNYILIGAGVAASAFLAASAFKKSKMLAAGIKCTIGRGNNKWYVDDASLVS